MIAQAYVENPSRHEADELVAATTAAALESDVLAICNPYPGDAMPLDVYGDLVANARAAGVRVIADLSSPRIEPHGGGRPGAGQAQRLGARGLCGRPGRHARAPARGGARGSVALGARNVLVTRAGDPALALLGDEAWELIPPKLEAGSREGCGDTMMGAIAAALAQGRELPDAMVLGAGAGAVNFLHHGLGTGSRREVEELGARGGAAPRPRSARREARVLASQDRRRRLYGDPVEMRSQELHLAENRQAVRDPQRPPAV